jgi:hypothetical protein
MEYTNHRSNRDIFIPLDSGSPKDGLFAHISRLGQIARLDFERFNIAGETIFKVEGDAFPTSQEDEEARIASLAYAIKKLGNETDAAEFIRSLNAICEDGDARSRQTIASYYYREIGERGVGVVLKEMAILAMQLAPAVVTEVEEEVITYGAEKAKPQDESGNPDEHRTEQTLSLFDQELASILKLVSGGRRASTCRPDEFENFLDQMISDGFDGEDLAARVESYENLMQYDESGAIIDERISICRQPRFVSHANRELQSFCRAVLDAILSECLADFHLTAVRTSKVYREFHKAIRGATDSKELGEIMRKSYEVREKGALPLKHFTALTTASKLQRIRLENGRRSTGAHTLLKEIDKASAAKLRYLSWAMYGDNQPENPVHNLSSQEKSIVWSALKSRRGSLQTATV